MSFVDGLITTPDDVGKIVGFLNAYKYVSNDLNENNKPPVPAFGTGTESTPPNNGFHDTTGTNWFYLEDTNSNVQPDNQGGTKDIYLYFSSCRFTSGSEDQNSWSEPIIVASFIAGREGPAGEKGDTGDSVLQYNSVWLCDV